MQGFRTTSFWQTTSFSRPNNVLVHRCVEYKSKNKN